jgi:beta-glucanase (GH16 family)
MRRRAIYLALVACAAALLVISACKPHGESTRSPAVPPAADTAGRTPSKAKMPVGDLPRWKQVLAENFAGRRLDPARWQRYRGVPGGIPGGWFDPSHLRVRGGKLVIDGYRDKALGGRWATGGVATQPALSQTYGKYLVRMRFAPGLGVNHAILLWPANEQWPPEIDFSETSGRSRRVNHATLHYGPRDTMIHRRVRTDLSRWHTVGVEWTPGRVVYTLDGRRWGRVTSRHVPSQPMKLAIQSHAWSCGTSDWAGCVGPKTPRHVRLKVDWVVTYALRTGA